MTEPEKTAVQNETGTKAWLKDLNENYPPTNQRTAKMTDKETEIKSIAGTIFDLRQKLSCMSMMNANKPLEELKKLYEEDTWLHYQLRVAENKLREASI